MLSSSKGREKYTTDFTERSKISRIEDQYILFFLHFPFNYSPLCSLLKRFTPAGAVDNNVKCQGEKKKSFQKLLSVRSSELADSDQTDDIRSKKQCRATQSKEPTETKTISSIHQFGGIRQTQGNESLPLPLKPSPPPPPLSFSRTQPCGAVRVT